MRRKMEGSSVLFGKSRSPKRLFSCGMLLISSIRPANSQDTLAGLTTVDFTIDRTKPTPTKPGRFCAFYATEEMPIFDPTSRTSAQCLRCRGCEIHFVQRFQKATGPMGPITLTPTDLEQWFAGLYKLYFPAQEFFKHFRNCQVAVRLWVEGSERGRLETRDELFVERLERFKFCGDFRTEFVVPDDDEDDE